MGSMVNHHTASHRYALTKTFSDEIMIDWNLDNVAKSDKSTKSWLLLIG